MVTSGAPLLWSGSLRRLERLAMDVVVVEVRCKCPGFAPGLNGLACNRPAVPGTSYCAGCNESSCWCSCGPCDPSSSTSSQAEESSPTVDQVDPQDASTAEVQTPHFGSNGSGSSGASDGHTLPGITGESSSFGGDELIDDTQQSRGVAGGGMVGSGDIGHAHRRWPAGVLRKVPVCTPCGPASSKGGDPSPLMLEVQARMARKTPLCICDHGLGSPPQPCNQRSLPNSRYCEDCEPDNCVCTCLGCYPDVFVREDYDHEDNDAPSRNEEASVETEAPRCICVRGKHGQGSLPVRCIQRSRPNSQYCEDCGPIRCVCACPSCYPDLAWTVDCSQDEAPPSGAKDACGPQPLADAHEDAWRYDRTDQIAIANEIAMQNKGKTGKGSGSNKSSEALEPPRCVCQRGGGQCEMFALRLGMCHRCGPRNCMCPCRGCDPDMSDSHEPLPVVQPSTQEGPSIPTTHADSHESGAD